MITESQEGQVAATKAQETIKWVGLALKMQI